MATRKTTRKAGTPGDADDRDAAQKRAGTSGMERVDPTTLSPAGQKRLRKLLGSGGLGDAPDTLLGGYVPPKKKKAPPRKKK